MTQTTTTDDHLQESLARARRRQENMLKRQARIMQELERQWRAMRFLQDELNRINEIVNRLPEQA